MKPTLTFFSVLCLAAALIILGSNQAPSRNQTFTSKSTALSAPASELLEEDFVVAPGEIAGAEKVSIDVQGELVLTSAGDVHLRKPAIYQQRAGEQHEIVGGYRLKGENDDYTSPRRYRNPDS